MRHACDGGWQHIGRPAHMVGREKPHVVVLSESGVWGHGCAGAVGGAVMWVLQNAQETRP